MSTVTHISHWEFMIFPLLALACCHYVSFPSQKCHQRRIDTIYCEWLLLIFHRLVCYEWVRVVKSFIMSARGQQVVLFNLQTLRQMVPVRWTCPSLRQSVQWEHEHLIYAGVVQWWDGLSFLFTTVSSGLLNEPRQDSPHQQSVSQRQTKKNESGRFKLHCGIMTWRWL